jgi:uncharacterized protein
MIIYKLDANGREVWQYPARLIARGESFIQVEAFFNRDNAEVCGVAFARGDRFVEYFYNNRWYNVFAVYDGKNGSHKGWYVNICRPAELGETAVRCEDLALDIWITPDGRATLLDEDEFAALNLPGEEQIACQRAATAVIQLAANDELPR